MAAQTPVPQLGLDLVQCTITGLTPTGNGLLQAGGTMTMLTAPPSPQNTGRRVNTAGSPGHQEINAMNTRQRNQVIIDDGYTLDLQVYNVSNGGDPSQLSTFWLSYDYFYVVWLENSGYNGQGGSGTHTWQNTFYGVRGDLDKPFEGRGEQLTTAHLLEMDPGYPNVLQYERVQIN